MEYEVTDELTGIDFGATGVKEILQNIRMILATPEFSCPMDRNFSWSPDIDSPLPVAQARITARLVEAIQTYEPRAEVTDISFQDSEPLNGMLKPRVRVRIRETEI